MGTKSYTATNYWSLFLTVVLLAVTVERQRYEPLLLFAHAFSVLRNPRLSARYLSKGRFQELNSNFVPVFKTRLLSTPPATPFFADDREKSKTAPATKSVKPVFTEGPDPETKPDYENIHGPFGKALDRIFLWVFRTKLAEFVGVDSKLPKTDYDGLIELTAALNARYSDRTQIQKIAQQTLKSLFPSWLPGQFAILFAKPFPEFSSRMNAWATYVAGTWLMGECEVNDIEIDGKVYKDQGLLVKRCRFLEESGCASVCVNSCKIPTQNFFLEDMGLPLTMTPDYDTHECQFAFGQMPSTQDELDAKNTPCLKRCPTAGSMRDWHTSSNKDGSMPNFNATDSKCLFMENPS